MQQRIKLLFDQNADVVPIGCRNWSAPQIACGLQNEDMHAVAELYERYGAMVNRIIRRILGPDSEHDDVVQNVFCGILDAAKKLKKQESLKDWVFGITARTALKELRSRKYRNRFTPHLDSETAPIQAISGEKMLLVSGFYRVLRKLDPASQVYIVLRFLEQRTNQEVAAACHVSVRTAKRRIIDAKSAFVAQAVHDPFIGSLIAEETDEAE